ncbi:MAG: hypothetical protein AB9866_16305 [Syntrophobacteraceae bacterium]
MIHRLIAITSLLVGIITLVLLAAIFFKNLTWWSWLPVSARPAVLISSAFLNLAAWLSVLVSRRFCVVPLQLPAMITNGCLFTSIIAVVVALYYLEYFFRM